MSSGAPALRILSYLPNPRLAKATIADRARAPHREVLVGDTLTLADVVFATELALFSAERAHPAFAPDLGPYLEKHRG